MDQTGTLLPWVRPQPAQDERLWADLRQALASGRLTNRGPLVEELERRLAAFLDCERVLALSSGSAALELGLRLLAPAGGVAVLPSFTFAATRNAILAAGLRPLYCDIDPECWTLAPEALERLLQSNPVVQVVIPVNVFGVPPELPAICRLAERHGAAVFADDAHGFGSQGPVAPVAGRAFSFHATKVLPAAEGGALALADSEKLDRARRLANHGLADEPLAAEPGHNFKLSEVHAALALAALRHFPAANRSRRAHAERLRRFIGENCSQTFQLQRLPPDCVSNFQNLGVLCRGLAAGECRRRLESLGIGSRRYFYPALHRLEDKPARPHLPVTESVAERVLCLPLYDHMSEQELERIERALLEVSRDTRR